MFYVCTESTQHITTATTLTLTSTHSPSILVTTIPTSESGKLT